MAFTEASLSRMKGVDPRLADLMHYLRSEGHNIQISEGLRDRARQQELFDQGASKTLSSKHLTGNAIDLHLRDPETGKAIWDEAAYAPLGALAKQYAADQGWGDDFTWGGDWGWDSVHFQTNNGPFAAAPPRSAPPRSSPPPVRSPVVADTPVRPAGASLKQEQEPKENASLFSELGGKKTVGAGLLQYGLGLLAGV